LLDIASIFGGKIGKNQLNKNVKDAYPKLCRFVTTQISQSRLSLAEKAGKKVELVNQKSPTLRQTRCRFQRLCLTRELKVVTYSIGLEHLENGFETNILIVVAV
jgi:hypothetical protein